MIKPTEQYRLAVVSNAPIETTAQARVKGQWLIETASAIDAREKQENTQAEEHENLKKELHSEVDPPAPGT